MSQEHQINNAVNDYAAGRISIGKAIEATGITRQEFEARLVKHGIARPSAEAEVKKDIAFVKAKTPVAVPVITPVKTETQSE